MPNEIEETLIKAENVFLWDGKKARVAHETMLRDIAEDIHVPIFWRTPLPEDLKRMVLAARKYRLQFTARVPEPRGVETAKMLIDSIYLKWNPTVRNTALCEEMVLSGNELECNNQPIETNQIMVFDPNFLLSDMTNDFRIFAFEESLTEISARRYKFPGHQPGLTTVFLNARSTYPPEFVLTNH
ncbi:hypothetical protein C8J57DRAFT_1238476 [Mycena rebaudengoi]|nr:hypothetical protein C8J57DRAFT_1238476 [Mycena rebaudengoi]